MYAHIGFWSPFIIILIVLSSIYERTPYMWLFLAIIPGNIILNKIIKNTIQEKRPENTKKLYDFEEYEEYDKYGMPSGHVAMSTYGTLYHYFLTFDLNILLLNGFLTCMCGYQRYESNAHTLEQIVVGALIGGTIAYAAVYFMKQHLERV